ncbi:PI-PLC X domain-containing protein At5g67130-like [Silene latifolia]|uniref:PI-PLC X domain-containing protein At5g67130-like n=1 Tax=Silene latifolia TaxID=37657 RepID=UPI003D78A284
MYERGTKPVRDDQAEQISEGQYSYLEGVQPPRLAYDPLEGVQPPRQAFDPLEGVQPPIQAYNHLESVQPPRQAYNPPDGNLRTRLEALLVVNISLPFNKYAFLATHNSFAVEDEAIVPVAMTCQEDSITQQLQNGVRALMLDTYDFKGEVWLCHSRGGKCHEYTAFEPAINIMMEIEAFLSSNPMEIVTLILEDYVKTPNGLTNLFKEAGLKKYWFPISRMPREGQDWPIVRDMVANNQRLIVFTSKKSKQITEGAYQWDYMVENQYGDNGMKKGQCINRGESSQLDDKSKSLVLINYIRSLPLKQLSCVDNSHKLKEMLRTCQVYAGDRWANFVAVDFYKRSEGGGAFEALDMLNGRLLCGRDDVHTCMVPPPRNNTVA